MKYGIHWFRRDLRVAGNSALQKQYRLNEGRVLGFFCFDKAFLSRPDFSVNRFQFFLKTLESLKDELNQLGSDLLVLDVGPFQAFPELIEKLQQHKIPLPNTVSWSRDYEPYAVQRDQKFTLMLRSMGVEYFHERDHLLIEPHELEKRPREGYQVYTPFSRKWLTLFQEKEFQNRVRAQTSGLSYLRKLKSGNVENSFQLTWKALCKNKLSFPDHLSLYLEGNSKKVNIDIPLAGSLAAFEHIQEFKDKIVDYGEKRDIPKLRATSRASIYLKNGSLTLSQILALFELKAYTKKESGQDIYLSELIWREFYYHILARHPHVEQTSFISKYQDLKWENSKALFDAWKEGTTGYPIVDAGMRQLNTTGWMHNRVRMIVASFLTKDLLIDWRWGEKYFMEKLLDGDLAPNNGGWQWAASTGCDPQPYFRIFNPWLQSKKFDPDGIYIKKYVPELLDTPPAALHAPISGHPSYPKPLVDHMTQKNKALALYKYT